MKTVLRRGALALGLLLACAAAAHADAPAPSAGSLGGLLPLLAGYPWLVYALIAGAGAPWLAALLPQAPAGSPWAVPRKVLDLLALNVGNAANAALAQPALRAQLAGPLPNAAYTLEHLMQAYEAGQHAAATPAPTAPAPAASAATAPVPGTVAAMLGLLMLAGVLGGCSAAQIATAASVAGLGSQLAGAAQTVVADGQLFCAVASGSGPIVSAVVNAASKSAVTVTGKAAADVAAICALIGGVPVAPPAAPAAAPVVAVALPAA